MRIDIHTHTRKCKSGDPSTREISAAGFCEAVLNTDVQIIAITNHNLFDLEQFNQIVEGMAGAVQVWPGVELDIQQETGRGHLLVIVDPEKCDVFSESLAELTAGSSPDQFEVDVEGVLDAFEDLSPLYVAHYSSKKPNIDEATLEVLVTRVLSPRRVIREVSNAISAGIHIAHGYPSIYGSDIQDWAEYETAATGLPELRLPVDSFAHFCLLLEKDPVAIRNTVDRKRSEDVPLSLFEGEVLLNLRLYNDINVIFGPKGTGKTAILDGVAEWYRRNGVEAKRFESTESALGDAFDLKAERLRVDWDERGVDPCEDSFAILRGAQEVDVTTIGDYRAHFSSQRKNRNASRIRLKDLDTQPTDLVEEAFRLTQDGAKATRVFRKFAKDSVRVGEALPKDELETLHEILDSLESSLDRRMWREFAEWKSVILLNAAIAKLQTEVARKSDNEPKPLSTGFRDYAMNRVRIAAAAAKIMRSVRTEIEPILEYVGSLGGDKGDLQLRTDFAIQSGTHSDGSYFPLNTGRRGRKNPLKEVARAVANIEAHSFSGTLFKKIAELNEIEGGDAIESVRDLILVRRQFVLSGKAYTPSSGETSMLLLHQELGQTKDIYILDEPERSLGNEYINDVIVPLIREQAKAGKKVIISTHDANIAVRTLPYMSIYRCHDENGYRTYLGNPFLNDLINFDDQSDRLDWKQVSMRTLEGGAQAFGERGRIYGHS